MLLVRFILRAETESRTQECLLKSCGLARKARANKEGKIAEEMSPTRDKTLQQDSSQDCEALKECLGPLHPKLKGKEREQSGRATLKSPL